jgi:hypothetical protein
MEYILLQAHPTFSTLKHFHIHNTRGKLIFMDGTEENLQIHTTPTETNPQAY